MPHKGPYTAEELFTPPQFTQRSYDTLIWKPEYHCACCNRTFSEQKGNFFRTRSELYKASNFFVPICKNCLNSYFEHASVHLRDEHQALLHIAQMMDWYVSDAMIDDILADSSVKKPVGELAKRLGRTNAPEGTYLDALLDSVVSIAPKTNTDKQQREEKRTVDPRAVELFGSGFSPDEYDLMLQHYDKLLRQFENADGLQEAIILKLCQLHASGQIAYTHRDMDGFEKMTRLYSQMLKDERLKAKKIDANADDDRATWGTILAMVEQKAPADAYQQDDFYRDVDGVDRYIRETYLRSVANYFGKTDERDPVYSLTDEEILGDG